MKHETYPAKIAPSPCCAAAKCRACVAGQLTFGQRVGVAACGMARGFVVALERATLRQAKWRTTKNGYKIVGQLNR